MLCGPGSQFGTLILFSLPPSESAERSITLYLVIAARRDMPSVGTLRKRGPGPLGEVVGIRSLNVIDLPRHQFWNELNCIILMIYIINFCYILKISRISK